MKTQSKVIGVAWNQGNENTSTLYLQTAEDYHIILNGKYKDVDRLCQLMARRYRVKCKSIDLWEAL